MLSLLRRRGERTESQCQLFTTSVTNVKHCFLHLSDLVVLLCVFHHSVSNRFQPLATLWRHVGSKLA